jgi:hypothetical protein
MAEHAERMGETKTGYKILVGKHERKNHSQDLGVDGRITSELILGKYGGKLWAGFVWLRRGISGGPL